MLRRLAALTLVSAVAILVMAAPAGAHVDLDPGEAVAGSTATTTSTATTEAPATSTTGRDLPGTTLEAQERDDGNTSAAPWIIGSGLAALAAIGIGGTYLKRRTG
ncbi:MAG: hypothetical protein ABIX10_14555 [Acidimicrobiales bacterium]